MIFPHRTHIAAVALVLAVPASAAAARPQLSSARCWPASQCSGSRTVAPGGSLLLSGRRFQRGTRAVFPVLRASGRHALAPASTRFLSSRRLIAHVPRAAVSGRVYVRSPRGGRSNAVGPIYVRRGGAAPGGQPSPPASAASGTAFDGTGMWIWYVSKSSGGDAAAIVAQARAHSVSAVFIKSSDGTNAWGQFNSALVSQLKAAGLHVCAWQFVYGKAPSAEATLGVNAVNQGAECLIIDAEADYEGRYGEASTYLQALRAGVGASYPLALSGFPYVDYHPAFPYSVFLGTGGAQFDLPQVYWKDIGTSVDSALSHSYAYNRPYGRPIVPTGQAYNGTSAAEITRFRQLVAAAGAGGVNWWDWQEASDAEWQAIGAPLDPLVGGGLTTDFATIGQHAKGDLVVWAQEHLRAAGAQIAVDGDYGAGTAAAVSSFQTSKGLPATGSIDTSTWKALLTYTPPVNAYAAGARAARAGPRSGPPTAWLPARRNEIRQVGRG